MCGIWAIFGSDGDVMLQCNAAHKIAHRGPDAFRLETIHHFPNCCLGFHRLAIVGDLTGMQPMRLLSHPHIWLMVNGEIYNHKMLSDEFGFQRHMECDAEVIIHLFAKGGIEFAAKQLDGVFAFCILDTYSRKVHLARDVFGVKPLFKMLDDTGFLAICSEAKGLTPLVKNGTSRSEIQPFPPGQFESYSLGSGGKATLVSRGTFHVVGEDPIYKTATNHAGKDTAVALRQLFESAVTKRLMSDRRVGCLLSGGLDSSLVTALVAKTAKDRGIDYPIQTFSVGMKGSPDLLAAKKVSTHLGTEHHEVVYTAEEALSVIEKVIVHLEMYDVATIQSSIAMYLLTQYIKEKTDTTVIYSGEGADELMQGYKFFHNAPSAEEADTESRRLCREISNFSVLRADKIPSAWGLELRVPFLDHKFTSYFLSIHPEQRQPQYGREKFLIRSAYADTGLLPEEILWRKKEVFSDGVTSRAKPWSEIIQTHVDKHIEDSELQEAQKLYPHNPPPDKEALYYRQIFEKHYPNGAKWMQRYWMSKWQDS